MYLLEIPILKVGKRANLFLIYKPNKVSCYYILDVMSKWTIYLDMCFSHKEINCVRYY